MASRRRAALARLALVTVPSVMVIPFLGFTTGTATASSIPTCFGKPATMVSSAARIKGTDHADVIVITGSGRHVVWAGAGRDLVCGSSSDDVIYGGNGDDRIHGRSGNDHLYGGLGDDDLDGDEGDDDLDGGEGDDDLNDDTDDDFEDD